MIDNYQERNREETLAAVSGFDADRLLTFIEFERAHKNRKTVVEPLEREIVNVTPTARRYAAGIWFDSTDDVRPARWSRRVEQAIDDGLLTVV